MVSSARSTATTTKPATTNHTRRLSSATLVLDGFGVGAVVTDATVVVPLNRLALVWGVPCEPEPGVVVDVDVDAEGPDWVVKAEGVARAGAGPTNPRRPTTEATEATTDARSGAAHRANLMRKSSSWLPVGDSRGEVSGRAQPA